MSFHFVVPGMADRTWLELIADALLWLGLVWLAVAAIVIVLMLLNSDQGSRLWVSTVLPLVVPSAAALVLGYIVNRAAKRGD